MDKLNWLGEFLCRHKYFLTVAVFLCLILFVDKNNIVRRMGYRREIHQLQQEIDKYRTQYEIDTQRLIELEENPDAIERIAREKYFMKRDNEDIYVFDLDK